MKAFVFLLAAEIVLSAGGSPTMLVQKDAGLDAAESDRDRVNVLGVLGCLTSTGVLLPASDCDGGSDLVLRSAGGHWRFRPDDPRVKIFSEPGVRHETLHVLGRRSGEGLEIIDLHVVQPDGHFLPHYRCEVCNITAYAPGLCWCCQQPFELRFAPVESDVLPEDQP